MGKRKIGKGKKERKKGLIYRGERQEKTKNNQKEGKEVKKKKRKGNEKEGMREDKNAE